MKIEAQRTPGSKVEFVLILVVMLAGIVMLVFGFERSAESGSSRLPPIPEADPAAQPKSLQQVGVPAETESDIDDLVAFLAPLTSANYKEEGATELARQRALSRTNRPQRDTAHAFGPKPPRPAPPK